MNAKQIEATRMECINQINATNTAIRGLREALEAIEDTHMLYSPFVNEVNRIRGLIATMERRNLIAMTTLIRMDQLSKESAGNQDEKHAQLKRHTLSW